MPSFADMKKKYSNTTIGQQLKTMADQVVQDTFDNDINTRQCYLYDYYHDDQADFEYGYDPSQSKTKIPAKLKFMRKTYKSLAKDDPEYHIMFEPDVWNAMSVKPQWFDKIYSKLGIKFPIGLFVDVPDDRGVYHRWIIMYEDVSNQFPKFGVLRCNYRFTWINNSSGNRRLRKVWGVEATQNSYTSGVYTDYKMTRFEEQGKFYLPWNLITAELKHDSRLIISMLQEDPYVYRITKVKNTSPKGIITFTVKQDRFDVNNDYICMDINSSDYGEMCADYYTTNVIPSNEIPINAEEKATIEAANNLVRIGSSKVLTFKVYDANNQDVTNKYSGFLCSWKFNLTGEDNNLIIQDEDYSLKDGNEFKCKFKFAGNEKYIGKNIIVICSIGEISSSITLNITAL